jgi:HPt (histidine-containing phosphotransfer) domain-containing protein
MMANGLSPTEADTLQNGYSVMSNQPKSVVHAAPAIDIQVIETLKAELAVVAPGLMAELIELFLTNTPDVLMKMRQAIAQDDADTLKTCAHTLKSNCARLGASICSRICLNLEMMGQNGHLDGGDEKLAELELEYERVEQSLRKMV